MAGQAGLNGNLRGRSVGRNVLLGFASIVILLLVSAGISHYNTRKLYENTSLLAKGRDIQDALTDVLSTMKDVETWQRGYVITGATSPPARTPRMPCVRPNSATAGSSKPREMRS